MVVYDTSLSKATLTCNRLRLMIYKCCQMRADKGWMSRRLLSWVCTACIGTGEWSGHMQQRLRCIFLNGVSCSSVAVKSVTVSLDTIETVEHLFIISKSAKCPCSFILYKCDFKVRWTQYLKMQHWPSVLKHSLSQGYTSVVHILVLYHHLRIWDISAGWMQKSRCSLNSFSLKCVESF